MGKIVAGGGFFLGADIDSCTVHIHVADGRRAGEEGAGAGVQWNFVPATTCTMHAHGNV